MRLDTADKVCSTVHCGQIVSGQALNDLYINIANNSAHMENICELNAKVLMYSIIFQVWFGKILLS